MTVLISTTVTSSLNHNYYSAITDLHTFHATGAHALGFSVCTSRLLATDLNTETVTSNYYEVFLSFLVQSPWKRGTHLKTLLDPLCTLHLLCSTLHSVLLCSTLYSINLHSSPRTRSILVLVLSTAEPFWILLSCKRNRVIYQRHRQRS
jgi:hypothetical protein